MILVIFQIVIAISLVAVILLQMQGSGLSSSFGGSGGMYRSKRSIEKLLIWATVILSALFAILSIILLLPQ
ncbi:MAG: preprotein translocase subunit SecG [bacterium]|nr:preprotein translocase subunit SecG [bacterium]